MNRVRVRVDGPAGPLELTAEYLVGCDGEQSTVRELAGFSLAGIEACVYPRDLDRSSLTALASKLGHEVVVSGRRHALQDARVVTIGELEAAAESPPPAVDRAPVLILTTGTTGEPKGVEWSHGALMENLRGLNKLAAPSPAGRWVSTEKSGISCCRSSASRSTHGA